MKTPLFIAIAIFSSIFAVTYIGAAFKWAVLLSLLLGVVLLWLAIALSWRSAENVPIAIVSMLLGLGLIVMSCVVFLGLAFAAM